uniref:Very-long-chain (3R)-3-hydroxyacyl-CoA dehydratase n=1 Tax=Mesocestoides corti TaxID=53468 RepID=A0A5K3F7Z5_MESCO
MSSLIKAYLAFYNGVQFTGWTWALFLALFSHGRKTDLDCERVLRIFQTLAILEVFHALLRLVRSTPFTTAIQIASRIFVLWGVLYLYPEVKEHAYVNKMMLVSWCFADATRYLYYFVNIFIETPGLLTFLRYNLFLVLYPTGIMGEISNIFYSLPHAAHRPWIGITMPNSLNFGFSTFGVYCVLLVLYIPGAPLMYSHMLAQRRKIMGHKKKSS